MLGYQKGLKNHWTRQTIKKEKEFYHSSYVHEGFISAVILLNDLIKILVLGILNCAIFKDLGSDCYSKNIISQ